MMSNKSRLVAQNYCDDNERKIATKAPTIQRSSQRALLCLAASLPGTNVFSRDITQAYVQATKPLERPVYIEAPSEMGLPKDTVLLVVKPLYGIPESGFHWYITYLEYHTERLGMMKTTADPCLMVKRTNGNLDGLVALQVDDSLSIGTEVLIELEEEQAAAFKPKPIILLRDSTITFNGVQI